MTMRSASSLRFSHQPGSDVAAAALDAMKDGVDPVMPEMIDGIDTDEPPLPRVLTEEHWSV
jgi:hypothetical protein